MIVRTNYLFYLMIFVTFLSGCEKEDETPDQEPAPSNTVINSNGETGTVTDITGITYDIIKIGEQWWMAENLRTNTFSDGTEVPLVTDKTEWMNLLTSAYSFYDTIGRGQDLYTQENYGALYNWYSVETEKLCPTGWFVPDDTDWLVLSTYLKQLGLNGGALKVTGTQHWIEPNIGATNELGFSALPAGARSGTGGFGDLGYNAYWWSSTKDGQHYAHARQLPNDNTELWENLSSKNHGFSVRCLREQITE